MKAALFDKYGPPEVLYIDTVEKPIAKDNEVLVKVMNSAVNAADYRIRGANFPAGFTFFAKLAFGFSGPRNKILGAVFSGVVEEIGKDVTRFKVGDKVAGMTGFSMGAYAEYISINENKSIAVIPENVSFEDAAAVTFGGTTALFFLRDKVKVKSGQKVLVNGASGAVGTNAVQLAKYYGAAVTGVCSSDNVELVKSLGADKVIDYKKEDIFNGEKYDVVLDTVGNIPLNRRYEIITPNGNLAAVVGSFMDSIIPRKHVVSGTASEKKEDIEFLLKLVSENKLKVVIDKIYPLDQIVEAHRHADTGHKVGNIVLKIS